MGGKTSEHLETSLKALLWRVAENLTNTEKTSCSFHSKVVAMVESDSLL